MLHAQVMCIYYTDVKVIAALPPAPVIATCGCLSSGVAARETAQALRTLAQAARGVAASTKEPQAAAAMLDSAQCVMEGSSMLIHEAHQALVHPGDAESQQRLAQVAQLPLIYISPRW